jgi:hypothetical protein
LDNHNIEKFTSQQIEYFKSLREKKFKELDVEFFIAIENDDRRKIKEIAILKNKLRDVTNYKFPDFEDPTEILNHVPDFLL